jgi:hypothetical protein
MPDLEALQTPPHCDAFALVLHEPGRPVMKSTNQTLHWMIFNISGTSRELPGVIPGQAQLPDGSILSHVIPDGHIVQRGPEDPPRWPAFALVATHQRKRYGFGYGVVDNQVPDEHPTERHIDWVCADIDIGLCILPNIQYRFSSSPSRRSRSPVSISIYRYSDYAAPEKTKWPWAQSPANPSSPEFPANSKLYRENWGK